MQQKGSVFMADAWILPEIDLEKCNRCGKCVSACATGALAMGVSEPFFLNPQYCTFCTSCEPVCPTGAIRCDFEIGWFGTA